VSVCGAGANGDVQKLIRVGFPGVVGDHGRPRGSCAEEGCHNRKRAAEEAKLAFL